MKNILLFGGSFDPPHLGHISTALTIQKHIAFDCPIILPCKAPVLKEMTTASCKHRVEMLKLAFEQYPAFTIDLREIQRDTPSYTSETLQNFRQELGEQIPITFLIGMDTFLQLPLWQNWRDLLQQCHLLVINRAQVSTKDMPEEVRIFLNQHEVSTPDALLQQPFGKIYQYNAGEYCISSTLIRQKLLEHQDVSEYLSEEVYRYIQEHLLYV